MVRESERRERLIQGYKTIARKTSRASGERASERGRERQRAGMRFLMREELFLGRSFFYSAVLFSRSPTFNFSPFV